MLGKAVDRNRIKRRMRAAVRMHVDLLTRDVDVVLHPRRNVLTMEFAGLESEVGKILTTVQRAGPRRIEIKEPETRAPLG